MSLVLNQSEVERTSSMLQGGDNVSLGVRSFQAWMILFQVREPLVALNLCNMSHAREEGQREPTGGRSWKILNLRRIWNLVAPERRALKIYLAISA